MHPVAQSNKPATTLQVKAVMQFQIGFASIGEIKNSCLFFLLTTNNLSRTMKTCTHFIENMTVADSNSIWNTMHIKAKTALTESDKQSVNRQAQMFNTFWAYDIATTYSTFKLTQMQRFLAALTGGLASEVVDRANGNAPLACSSRNVARDGSMLPIE